MLYHEIFANHAAHDPALIFNGQVTTYGQFRERIRKWAAYLQSLGVKKGDRVGLFGQNSSEFLVAYFAVITVGGIIVPFNYQLAMPELAYIIKDANIHYILAKEALPLEAAVQDSGYEGPLRQIPYAELDGSTVQGFVAPEIDDTDICTIIFTSGTTGRPKGAMLNHRNLIRNTADINTVLETYKNDRTLCVLPMYHCFAWTTSVSAPLHKGGCIVIEEQYSLAQTIELIHTYHVQQFFGVPTMIRMLLDYADPEQLRSVRFFITGGAPMPRELAKEFKRKFGSPVQEGYGLSEASPVVSVNPTDNIRLGSIGLPLPSVKTQIRDTDEQEVAPGVIGELCVKGQNVMSGYLNHPEETAEALRGGWLHTGDLAYKDEDGYIFIVDRLKDMIITAGENVYPREIEEVLYHNPLIKEVAVIGVPDDLRGQAIAAYVVLKEGMKATSPQLKKFIRGKVANYKLPKYFEFIDQLPKNKTGKVLKMTLRRQSEEYIVNKTIKRSRSNINAIRTTARKK
jgi:long-chain acyl-CoA synthetase